MDKDLILSSVAFSPNDLLNDHDCVASFVGNNGQWDYAKLSQYLPNNCINQICSTIPLSSTDGQDTHIWTGSTDGCFFVKSEYRVLWLLSGSTYGIGKVTIGY